MLKISIDLMGGDNAPDSVLKAISNFKDIYFIISGTKSAVNLIRNYKIKHFEIIITESVLEEGMKASKTQLENSSIYSAVMQAANKNADCVISAGTTGYYLLICKKLLGTINEIPRPALAMPISTLTGQCILMDLGANLSCNEFDLVNFAIIGSSLSQVLLGKTKNKIGILNVGKEEGKGPEILKKTMFLLKDKLKNSTISFSEGHSIFTGEFDLIITDGFTGNCILKAIEGSSAFLKSSLKKELNKTFMNKLLGFLFKKPLEKIIPNVSKYNGAMFVGINGCAIKAHGNSDYNAYLSAINFAINISKQKTQITKQIKQDLDKLK